MPGPKHSSFIFGNLTEIQRGFADGKIFCMIVHEWSKEHGRVFSCALLHRNMVIVSDAVAVKHLLITVNCAKGPIPYDTFSIMYGERLYGDGMESQRCFEKWAKRRSLLNPAFHRRFLQHSIDQFNASVDLLIDKLREKTDCKTAVSMSDEFLRWGLDVIAKVGFGTDYNVIFEAENPFLKANQLVLSAMTRCVRFPLDKFNPMSRGFRQDARAAVRFLRKTGRDVVEKRLAARSNGEYVNEDDIIGHMLKASDYLKNPEFGMEDILDEFVTLFLAGHETTANTVAFMLMELIRNQDILDRLRTEIEDVLCGRTEVEFEDLTKLSYMSQVFKETLRMYPSAAAVPRENKTEVEVTGIRIPANSFIAIDLYSLGRQDEYFEDPDTFNPDRFSDANALVPNTYIPFSLGPRNCIGQNFAQIEAKVLFAKLLPLFDFTWVPGQSYDIIEVGTIRLKEGCQTYITLR